MIQIKYPTGSRVVVRFTGEIRGVPASVEKEMVVLGHQWHQQEDPRKDKALIDKILYYVDETTEGKSVTTVEEKDIVPGLVSLPPLV